MRAIYTIPTWVNGRRGDDHDLDTCCITKDAFRCLSELYCTKNYKQLWIVAPTLPDPPPDKPCTPAPSVACRDEALLTGGRQRHARSCWIAIGPADKPIEIVGLVNFRPIVQPTRAEQDLRGLNIAEAYLRLPYGWSEDAVLLADERYLRAFHTGILPTGNWQWPRARKGPFARIATVPYSSQWHTSGTCAQASMFMVSLQLCLQDRGHTRVEGPFTISCVAEDVRAEQTGITEVVSPSYRSLIMDPIVAHEAWCAPEGLWRREVGSCQKFRISGVSPPVMAETLKSVLADPWEAARGRARWDLRRMVPVCHQYRPERMDVETFRKTLESYLASSIPILVQVDHHALREAAKKAGRTRELASGTMPREVLDNVHCVLVIGARDMFRSPEVAQILYHCPLDGPYRMAFLRDFYEAACMPGLASGAKRRVRAVERSQLAGDRQGGRKLPELGPRVEMIAPVPDYVCFHPPAIFQLLRKIRLALGYESEFICTAADRIAEWRVRLIPRERVWQSYFASRTALTKSPALPSFRDWSAQVVEWLLPPCTEEIQFASERIMCLEVYESSQDASEKKPKTVFFAHANPDGSPPTGYRTPFTGGFGVRRKRRFSDVLFFRMTSDGMLDSATANWWSRFDEITARETSCQEITQ